MHLIGWGGYFYCNYNKLTTLEGSPIVVGESFYCDYNNLTTLEGAPREVRNDFYCTNNKLTTLKGAPIEIWHTFNCRYNNLTSLEGAPTEIGRNFYFLNNKLPEYFTLFMKLNSSDQLIIKQIIKWQGDYELWKTPEMFEEKFKRMMQDIQEIDLPNIKIRFPS